MIPVREADKKEVERIVNIIEDYFKLERGMIHDKSQIDGIRIPRQFAHYLVKKRFKHNLSLRNIGELIGNKSHGTILNSLSQINNLMETEQLFRDYYKDLKKLIKQGVESNQIIRELYKVVPL